MRWLLAILEALAALSAAGAEPPRYTVTNRTTPQPAFQVTNRIGATPSLPDPYKVDYAALLAQVENGLPGLLTIGGKDEQAGGYWAHAWVPSGSLVDGKGEVFPDGVWYCSKINGVASMVPWDRTKTAATASGVAVQNRPFRASRSTPVTVVKTVVTSPPPVQVLGSSGAIYPAGSIYTNAPYAMLSGNTNCVGFR